MGERRFEERRGLLCNRSKVDDPLIGGALNEVPANNPGPQHVGIRAAVGVRGKPQPTAGDIALDVERAVLVDAQKRSGQICRQFPRLSEVESLLGKVCVDVVRCIAVQ